MPRIAARGAAEELHQGRQRAYRNQPAALNLPKKEPIMRQQNISHRAMGQSATKILPNALLYSNRIPLDPPIFDAFTYKNWTPNKN
jgi:hypothetical protein